MKSKWLFGYSHTKTKKGQESDESLIISCFQLIMRDLISEVNRLFIN